jgi:acetate kinase
MSHLILAVNAGSSSLKISVFEPVGKSNDPKLLLNASITNISSPPASISFQETTQELPDVKDHASAFTTFLKLLESESNINPSDIHNICHRVVHGGSHSEPVVLDQTTYHEIESLSDLAPLHNGAALSVIKACMDWGGAGTNIAYFDTAFHTSIPKHISMYPIDQKIATERGLKKYGFHGLSYAFILRSVAYHLQKPINETNLIVLHLGSGASACCIRAGKSYDTSMGLTPVEGLPGATRSGAIDPSLVFHYTNTAGRITHDKGSAVDLHVTQAETILNKESGWNALTGTTDFGEIVKHSSSSSKDDNKYKLAFDLFIDRILNYVGSYHLKSQGHVDALVFAGGIGEKSKELRSAIGERVKCLGFAGVDEGRNERVGKENGIVVDIGLDGGKKLLVCRTDEQLEMARQCAMNTKFSS